MSLSNALPFGKPVKEGFLVWTGKLCVYPEVKIISVLVLYKNVFTPKLPLTHLKQPTVVYLDETDSKDKQLTLA